MAGTYPEAWEEVALVSIMKKSGSVYQFAAATETIDIAEGDHPGESIGTVGGGGVWKQSRQEDGEITLELYPINIDSTSGQGLFQQFYGGTWDTSQPLATPIATPATGVMFARDRFAIAIMWTDDTSQANAFATTTGTDFTALRFWAKGCRITSHKSEYTDGILKTTVTLKFQCIAKAGTDKNYAWESTNDTDTAPLPAVTYA